MDRAPLPPHERPWRHPSELGPPEHEPTTTGGRVIILTTATLSMLLIGVLAISMTPDRSSPESAVSTITGLRTAPVTAAALDQPSLPIVTPLGDGGWAVTTMSALAGRSGSVRARLPSGDVVVVEVVATDRSAGLTVVSLPEAGSDGYELAAAEPSPDDTVLVRSDPPQTVTMIELAALDVDEATPVLDGAGDLIGLCTNEREGVALRTVATMPDDPTTTVAATEPTTAPTAAPTTAASTRPDEPPDDAADDASHDDGPEHDARHRRDGAGQRARRLTGSGAGESSRNRARSPPRDGSRPAGRTADQRWRRRHHRTAAAMPPAAASEAVTIPASASSWRRLGVIIVHQRASVPSTKACSLVTVGTQP